MRLKNYSSGMHVRLAFSVAIQVDAEILLIDESSRSVTPASSRSASTSSSGSSGGRTILFVTHDMNAIERFCDRAMLLDKGRMIAIGDPAAIARRYNELNFGQTIHDIEDDSSRAEELEGARARPRSSTPGSRTPRARASHRSPTASGAPRASRCTSTRRSMTQFRRHAAQRRRRHGVRDHDGLRPRADGHFAAGDTAVIRLRFEVWFTQTRLHADAVDRARRDGLRHDRSPRRRRLARGARRQLQRPAWSISRTRSRSSAGERDRKPRRRQALRPNAFGDDIRRFVNLTFTLANTDFKLTYFGSVLGYVWSLMQPLLYFGVLLVIFTKIFQVGKNIPHYSVMLLGRSSSGPSSSS